MRFSTYDLSTTAASTTSGLSTLLIPEFDSTYFKQRCQSNGGRRQYFGLVVHKYLPRINEWRRQLNSKRDPNWKTVYQERGQDLNKRNFSPDAADWEAFRHCAGACGVSMCFLFVFLMELERSGFFDIPHKKRSCGMELLVRIWVKVLGRGEICDFFRKLDRKKAKLRRSVRIW